MQTDKIAVKEEYSLDDSRRKVSLNASQNILLLYNQWIDRQFAHLLILTAYQN